MARGATGKTKTATNIVAVLNDPFKILGRLEGFEPSTSGATDPRSNP